MDLLVSPDPSTFHFITFDLFSPPLFPLENTTLSHSHAYHLPPPRQRQNHFHQSNHARPLPPLNPNTHSLRPLPFLLRRTRIFHLLHLPQSAPVRPLLPRLRRPRQHRHGSRTLLLPERSRRPRKQRRHPDDRLHEPPRATRPRHQQAPQPLRSEVSIPGSQSGATSAVLRLLETEVGGHWGGGVPGGAG